MNKVLIIGCGHMGSALLEAWLDLKFYSFDVVDPFNFKILNKKYLNNKVKIFNKTPNQVEIKKYDVIIFAIKPVNELITNKKEQTYSGCTNKRRKYIHTKSNI